MVHPSTGTTFALYKYLKVKGHTLEFCYRYA